MKRHTFFIVLACIHFIGSSIVCERRTDVIQDSVASNEQQDIKKVVAQKTIEPSVENQSPIAVEYEEQSIVMSENDADNVAVKEREIVAVAETPHDVSFSDVEDVDNQTAEQVALNESDDDKIEDVVDAEPKRTLMDEIAVVVYGKERTAVICKSEISRLSIDGRRRTLEDMILDELMYQDAIHYKIPIDESVIDKYITSLRQERGLSMEQIMQAFSAAGYSYEEGREQLKMIYAKNGMIDHKITSRLIVTRAEVEKYYNAHPVMEAAEFTLKMTFVPFDKEMNAEIQSQQLQQDLIVGKATELAWGQPFTLKEDEIAKGVDFIRDMNEGDFSHPIKVRNGFEIYQLTAKKDSNQLPLEKVYLQMVQKLKEPKLQELLEDYKKELFDSASIVYNDEQLQEQAA